MKIMKAYKDLTKDELLTLKAALEVEYKEMESKGLNLNMARGKPGYSQLELCTGYQRNGAESAAHGKGRRRHRRALRRRPNPYAVSGL